MSVECALKRLDQDIIENRQHKHMIGDMDLDANYDMDGTIDQAEWESIVTRPTPLEEWACSLPLGYLVAGALAPLVSAEGACKSASQQLQKLRGCSKEDLAVVCCGLMDGVTKLLEDAIDELKSGPVARPSRLARAGRIVIDPSSETPFDAVADDEEVVKQFFASMRGSDDEISEEEIDRALQNEQGDKDMADLLGKMKSKAPVSLEGLRSLIKETPRLSGQRIVWSASLGLETLFAKHLRSGSVFDGLKGIKEMSVCELQSACRKFSLELTRVVEREWLRIAQVNAPSAHGKSGFEGLMNKFIDEGGFLGQFGNVEMFHAGLESQIGYPNPKLFKAILREHCFSTDSEDVTVTGNYGIAFSPVQEFARLLGKDKHPPIEPQKLPIEFLRAVANSNAADKCKGPTVKELEEVADEIKRLEKVFAFTMKRKNSVFPGEDGDEHQESICEVTIYAENETEVCSISADFSNILAALNERHEDFLSGKVDKSKKAKKSDLDLRDAEAIARGINLVGTVKSCSDNCQIVANLSVPVSQRERKEQFKFRDAIEEILRTKQMKFQKVAVDEKHTITHHFVDNLLYFGPQLSEEALRKVLSELSNEELVARLKTLVGTKNEKVDVFDRDSSIDRIVQLQKAMTNCKQARRRLSLMELMDIPEVKRAKLRVEEAIVVYQYTGPLFQKWNGLLRQIPNLSGNRYTTTIHVLVSAVLKLSQTTKVPQGRRVYRGLGGMVLDDKWFRSDERNTRGGVELGFLSTTLNRSTALEYSGVKKGRGIVLEIDVGAIDCGAQLDCLSQYPGEGELLFSPLSYLEVVGMPCFQIFEGKQVVVIQVKININLKAQKIEDMIAKRQQMHLASFEFLEDSVKYDIQKIADENNAFNERLKEDKFRKNYTVDEFVEGIVKQVQERRKMHKAIKSTDYLDNDIFRGLVIDMLDTAAMAQSKMRLYLDDKSLYIHDVSKLSLSAGHRMRIAHSTKNLPEDPDQRREAAKALCRLKGLGLQHTLNRDQKALIAAAANGLSLEDLKLLIDTGIDINQQDDDGSTAVYVAAQCGNAHCIESLVELGASVNIRDDDERTALFAAAKIGDLKCVKLLVKLGAHVDVEDKQKSTALMVAAAAGYFDCVKELANMKSGDSIDLLQLKPEMLSALTVAIEKGQIEVVEYIMPFIAKDHKVELEDFRKFSETLLKRIDLKSLSVRMLSTVGINAQEDDSLDKFVNSFYENFVSTILEVKEFLGDILFQFCDVDNDQVVSDKEVVDCLRIVMAVAAANDFVAEFSGLAKAIFRIFDLDGNGSIELEEAASIANQLLREIHRLIIAISTHFQNAFRSNRAAVHEILGEGIGMLRYEMKMPTPIEDLTSVFYTFLTSSDLSEALNWLYNDAIPDPKEAPEELQKFLLPAYESLIVIRALALVQLRSFFTQMIALARDVSTGEFVSTGLQCIQKIFDGVQEHSDKLSICTMDVLMFTIQTIWEEMPSDNPLKFILVDKTIVQNIFDAVLTSVASYLKDTGGKKYLQALSPVFANESGNIKAHELMALQQLIEVGFAHLDPEAFKEKCDDEEFASELKSAVSTMIASIDTNQDSFISISEILGFVDKIVQCIISALDATTDMMEAVFLSAVKPLLAMLFDVKGQVIGGSRKTLTYTDISSVALAFGMAMGEFRVLQFAMEIIENDEGNVDQETLQAVCFPLFKLFLGSPPARNFSAQFFSTLDKMFERREFLAAIHNSLVDKVEAICPIVSHTIFRLLDLDRNGTVTKDEVAEIIDIIKEFDSDSSPSKQLVSVAHAVFRVFDLDRDGSIDFVELSKCVSEIVSAIFQMLFELLRVFQGILMGEPLAQIVDQFVESMKEDDSDSSEQAGVSVERLISVMNSGFSGDDLIGLLGLVKEMIENPPIPDEDNDDMRQMLGSFKEILNKCFEQYQLFFVKAEESAVNDNLRKDLLIDMGADCFNQILNFMQSSAGKFETSILDLIEIGIRELLSSMPDKTPAKFLKLEKQMVHDILTVVFGAIHSYLSERGGRRYLAALLNLCDLQNTGNIKSSDFMALKDMVDAMFIAGEDQEMKDRVEQFSGAIFKLIAMFDTDGDATLEKAEIVKCGQIVGNLVFTWIESSLEMMDKAIIAAIVPLANLILNLKSQFLGGSEIGLTHADVCSAIFAVRMTEGDMGIIGYLKDLLVYKEGDVDEKVFANLCSNLVRLYFFWEPNARSTSKNCLSGFADLVAWEPSEEEFASFHEKIMDEFSCICPFLGQALYRFFDMDKSGKVSASEVRETLDLIQGILSGTETDPIVIGKGFFRIFDTEQDDEDGEVAIKLPEMNRIVSEIVDLLTTLFTQTLKHLEESIMDDPLKAAILRFCEKIEDPETPGVFAVKSIVRALSEGYSSQDLSELLGAVMGAWEQASSVPAFARIQNAICEQAQELFDRATAVAVNGSLNIDEFANIGTECFSKIIACLVKVVDEDKLEVNDDLQDLLLKKLSQAVGLLSYRQRGEEIFKEQKMDSESVRFKLEVITVKRTSKKVTKRVDLSLTLFQNIYNGAARAVHAQLTDTGIRKIMGVLSRLVYATKSVCIEISDLTTLRDLAARAFGAREDGDELKANFEEVLAFWFALSAKQAQAEGGASAASLEYEEVLAFAAVALQMGFTLCEELISALKSAALHIATPSLELALTVKGQVLNSGEAELTYDDIEALKKMFEIE